jgi:valyl-tRNA synthetase
VKLPKIYEPKEYESDIYALWERTESFAPENHGGKGTFTVVMPPPNANGNLHLGHALTVALEDIAVRYNRLKGKSTLYLPGADHAGFETWVVYEKKLNAEGKTRFDFSREELYRAVWDFVQLNKTNFESQLRALGASCDWSRYTYTLDDKVVATAYKVFKKLWDDKLIYRGVRLVNFCTFHGTSFSDIEVTYKESKGKLWHINYPLTDGSGSITVATTRPETMLGDVAVAVHPDDPRYEKFIGKTVRLPLTHREIPIIADTFVEKDFGSGAVKITPAHDQNDYECAERHDLPRITVISHEGTMTHEVPEQYRGLKVDDARQKILEDLKKQALIDHEEEHVNNIGHCYKCDTVIQPLLREQWFVSMAPLAKEAIAALSEEKIVYYPAAKREETITYLKNIRDWNISRQIAWGIPIPAFQNIDDPEDWIFDDRVTEEFITVKDKTYKRDPDVFDTWFSSGQWPYITLGWPDDPDAKRFYPNSLMETGKDLLQQWVARMIMLGLYVTKDVPFKEVYMHGMVLDEHGQKMSKSKGNVIDPTTMIHEYGSDALRMGVITGQSAGNNQPFGISKMVAARNFANKLWNISRYIEDKAGDHPEAKTEANPITAADHWMLQSLGAAVDNVDKNLKKYRFSEAYDTLYHFVWDDFADWYLEASKTTPNIPLLRFSLEAILKIAHPFAPFVTETIWQTLAWQENTLLITSNWPKIPKADAGKAAIFEDIKTIVSEARYMISAMQLREPRLYFTNAPFLSENADIIKHLARLKTAAEVSDGRGLNLTQTKHHCWLDVDLQTARDYLTKLREQQTEKSTVVKRLAERLANKAYTSKAPRAIVTQTQEQLEAEKILLNKITAEADAFENATKGLDTTPF